MPIVYNLLGQRFGRLQVISRARAGDARAWICRCDCGRETGPIITANLTSGNTRSCGCYRGSHHQSETKLYKVWSSMKSRCANPTDASYENYGGRGIAVCQEWQTFESFRDWAMVAGYREGLTIERRDNDCGYSPDNCIWIPKPLQSSNTRRCVYLTFQGKTQHMKRWARELGIAYSLVQSRIKHGWSAERALITPTLPRESCNNHLVTYQGRTMSLAAWAREKGINHHTLQNRLTAMCWSIERALETPVRSR